MFSEFHELSLTANMNAYFQIRMKKNKLLGAPYTACATDDEGKYL